MNTQVCTDTYINIAIINVKRDDVFLWAQEKLIGEFWRKKGKEGMI